MFISCCKYKGKTIGIARLVGDKSVHGLLCDVIVLPEFRHQSIVRTLISNIKDKVYEMLENNEQF